MGIFGLSKPNIEKMMRKKDVDGLIMLLSCKDMDLRKKAAEALASLLTMKSKPETLDDVKVLLGRDATKVFSFRQKGDEIYIESKVWGVSDRFEEERAYVRTRGRILRLMKELGGHYESLPAYIIPLYKPPPAHEGGKPIYLDPELKEIIAEELGKFGDDLAVGPLFEYANSSPLTAIQALSAIGSERANETLRMMLLNEYREHGARRIGHKRSVPDAYAQLRMKSDESWIEIEKMVVLEEALIDHRDYEGCREIIRVYSEEIKEYEPIDEAKALIFRTIKQIMEKDGMRNDKELLMIFLKCLGAFPANFSGYVTWLHHYYVYDIDDYGNICNVQKKLIAASQMHSITLEEFKEYLLNLDLEVLRDEEVLNHMVTLIPEYPKNLEANPIATALQRVESEKRASSLKKYLKIGEDSIAERAPFKVQIPIEDIIDSLRYWLSLWKSS